jgi:hypothetical protein
MLDKPPSVKHTAYMNFKDATDELFKGLSHAELAEALGVSVASIRQARLPAKANAFREPPAEWREAVIKLAERRASQYLGLMERLQRDTTSDR